jgi:hypothetical protein
MHVPEREILDAKAVMTIVAGRTAWSAATVHPNDSLH